MTIKKTRVSRMLLISLAAGLGISACGGKETKTEEKAQPALGQQSVSEGESVVSRKERVTQTVEKQTDIPTVSTTTIKADLNRMDPSQLSAIGVPTSVAENIVEYREERGGFTSLEQLREVEGMDSGLYQDLQNKVTIAQR